MQDDPTRYVRSRPRPRRLPAFAWSTCPASSPATWSACNSPIRAPRSSRSRTRRSATRCAPGAIKGLSLHWKVYARNKKSLAIEPAAAGRARSALLDLLATVRRADREFPAGHAGGDGLRPRHPARAQPGPDHRPHHRLRPGRSVSRSPGFGTLVEAMSGFAAKNGYGDRPPVLPPLAMADMVSGLYGAYADHGRAARGGARRQRPGHRPAVAGADDFRARPRRRRSIG